MRICIRVLLSAVSLSATMFAANAAQRPFAPAKAHAAASAAEGPVILGQLRARATEDVASDEPYLKVNGRKVWGPRSIDEGQQRPIGVVVHEGDKVSLYEEDLGGPFDDDDFLGDAEVKGASGTLEFSRDDANYTLSYRPMLADFVLKRGPLLTGAIRRLDGRLRKSGVQALLSKANRKLTDKGCAEDAAVPGRAKVYCFEPGDNKTAEWVPQGVTTSSDAKANERWGRERALIVTWYDKGKSPEKGVRLSFVSPDRRRYRHVLLVYPTRTKKGKPTYRAVNSHAGGIAWYGNYLYVAETKRGVRVFDVRKIFDLGLSKNGTTRNRKRIGLKGKTYYGAGNRYVLPQLTYYGNAATQPKESCTGVGAPVHSWVSVDRSQRPDVLMTGEYCANKGARARIGLWRLRDLDPDGSGTARAQAVNYLPARNGQPALKVQGGEGSHGNYWFTYNVTFPKGRANPGKLMSIDWTAGGVWHNRDDIKIFKGPEDLSCWRSNHRLWTVAEHAKHRALYGVRDTRCR